MAQINCFEDLSIWKDSRCLVGEIYSIFSSINDFSFRDQIQRATVSIMNNIAEGFERGSDLDFCRFLYIAKSSCGEVRSMLYLALDLHYLDEEKTLNLQNGCKKISSSIQNLISYLKQNTKTPKVKN